MRQSHSGTCFDTLVHTSIVAFEVFSRGIGSYPDTKLPWNVEEDVNNPALKGEACKSLVDQP